MTYTRVNPNGSRWSDENTEKLRTLWVSGVSCIQIANELGNGFTRNAIIGKAQRMGLGTKAGAIRQEPAKPQRAKQITPPKPRPKPALGLAGSGMAFDRGEDRPPLVPRQSFAVAFSPLPGSRPGPWEERRAGQCKWPIDAPDGAVWSCCEPCGGDRYCPQHTVTSAATIQPKANTGNKLSRSLRMVTG